MANLVASGSIVNMEKSREVPGTSMVAKMVLLGELTMRECGLIRVLDQLHSNFPSYPD